MTSVFAEVDHGRAHPSPVAAITAKVEKAAAGGQADPTPVQGFGFYSRSYEDPDITPEK
ncbi:MAG TPA: hypothetical protein VHB27_12090 [Rhodopila sp.]|uniref:hypothetical protein n=1 Tax=Rhodopila sp. TaxID=2480087 RepID=UPI002CADC23F|nr:hypothetical protein [Rhodopila sp.]HVY15960.1 hypothetical protein [Rhodopila sp.]